MSNRYGYELEAIAGGGYKPCIQICRESRPSPIKGPGGVDKVFRTKVEALEELLERTFDFMNGKEIRGEQFEGNGALDNANAHFNLPATERPKSVKQRGKGRRIEVIRAGARA